MLIPLGLALIGPNIPFIASEHFVGNHLMRLRWKAVRI
jgi:hypothetical protein